MAFLVSTTLSTPLTMLSVHHGVRFLQQTIPLHPMRRPQPPILRTPHTLFFWKLSPQTHSSSQFILMLQTHVFSGDAFLGPRAELTPLSRLLSLITDHMYTSARRSLLTNVYLSHTTLSSTSRSHLFYSQCVFRLQHSA